MYLRDDRMFDMLESFGLVLVEAWKVVVPDSVFWIFWLFFEIVSVVMIVPLFIQEIIRRDHLSVKS